MWHIHPFLWVLFGIAFVFGEGILLTYKDWHYFQGEPEQKSHDDHEE